MSFAEMGARRVRAFAAVAVCFPGLLPLAGCHRPETDHDHEPAAAPEAPGLAHTLWTDHHELFAEHPALIAGEDARFAVHFTVLPSFQAATDGAVTVTIVQAGGATVTGRVEGPKVPGIFGVTVRPTAPGKCSMTITIERAGASDAIAIPTCEVFADTAAAIAAAVPEEEGAPTIPFLKEQQWKTTFAIVVVAERPLVAGIRASGEIRPVAGKEARVSAPLAGRVVLADPPPIIGMAVSAGTVLATIAPSPSGGGDRASLDAEIAAARAELGAAEAALSRAERLYAERVVPEKQVEEARARASVARARLAGATGRAGAYRAGASGAGGAGTGGLQLRAPIAGTLVAADVVSGETVESGQTLFTIVDLERVWLVAHVFEPDLPRLDAARSATFTVEGYDEIFEAGDPTGRLVTIGRVLDSKTRTVPAIFELPNAGGKLRVGLFASVTIASGPPTSALAIPATAIVDDAGKPVVYVQVDGEAFERRPIVTGARAGGWVEVKSGLRAGERVVSRGAYEVKLASAAGSVPAHGHAH